MRDINEDTLKNVSKMLNEEYAEYLRYYQPIEKRLLNYGYIVNANMMLYYKDRIMKQFEETHNVQLKHLKFGDLNYFVLSSDKIAQEIKKYDKIKKINTIDVAMMILSTLCLFVSIFFNKILIYNFLILVLSMILSTYISTKEMDIRNIIINKLCECAVIELDKYDKEHVDNIIHKTIRGSELSDNDIIKIKKFYNFEKVKELLNLK